MLHTVATVHCVLLNFLITVNSVLLDLKSPPTIIELVVSCMAQLTRCQFCTPFLAH